jgi:hypothetical protein
MSKRLVVSVTVLLIVGIAIVVLGVMLFQALHPFAAPAPQPLHSHW